MQDKSYLPMADDLTDIPDDELIAYHKNLMTDYAHDCDLAQSRGESIGRGALREKRQYISKIDRELCKRTLAARRGVVR